MKLLDVVAEHHMPITVCLQYRCLVKNVSAVAGVFLQIFVLTVGKMLLSCE